MSKRVADYLYKNGVIYTADSDNRLVEAIAIADGVIIAVGSSKEVAEFVGGSTKQIDLQGKMVMPSIIDAHMHPFWGGYQLNGCSLNYQSLTVEQILAELQQFLDNDPIKGENDWLRVTAWLRQGMLPEGADMTRDDLDRLQTKRPLFLFSNDCHTLVANSRALTLFGIDESTPEPKDGKIGRDENGRLTGILEDAPAMRASDSLPQPSDEQHDYIAQLVQKTLNAQGVTTVMDARVAETQLDTFLRLQQRGELNLRILGCREITPDDAPTPESVKAAVAKVAAFAKKYNQAELRPEAGIAVHAVKLFIDGVLQPPIRTARLLEPYRENRGSADKPDWQPTERFGDLYFSPEVIDELMVEIAAADLDPHLHTVGEGAVSISLDAVEKMRSAFPNKDIRPGFAHNELVATKDYQRFAKLGVIPFLSFQWAAPTPEIAEVEREMLGDERYQNLEPIAKFVDAGAKVAFGSDWPIDGLDEWFALKVATTRRGRDIAGKRHPRFDTDRDLTLIEALRAMTIDAAYSQRFESKIGSLEVGKFADFIVLDRNLFEVDPETLDQTNVLLTVIGGKVVHEVN
ncbi:amidohydrolase [Orbaceae bacterium ESL0721]|nr:amidohydrolase [Orbaceae bacterium ESL0721]